MMIRRLFGLTFFVFAFVLLSALVSKSAFAQSPEDLARQYSVAFPIEELGNCGDFSSCRTYCEDPVNTTTCIEFAKRKGFYKEEIPTEEKFIKAAKEELGCDSAASCMKICDDPLNFDKCDKFAKKLSLGGGYMNDPQKAAILEKAKEALGCDSYGTCVSFCSQEQNRQKCSEFAKDTGLRGGEQSRGPGGCSSEGTCRAYCSDPNNFSECAKYAPPNVGNFKGPGGCDSPESCRAYCEKNPDSCRSYAPGASGRYVPLSCGDGQYFGPGGACTPKEKSQEAENCFRENKYWNGNSCHSKPPEGIHIANTAFFQTRPDMGNCSTPGSCYDWCKANPGKCQGFNLDSPRPDDSYVPTLNYAPGSEIHFAPNAGMGNCTTPGSCYDWCKANPGRCGGFNPDSTRPTENNTPASNYTPPSSYTPPTSTQTQTETQPTQTQTQTETQSQPAQDSGTQTPPVQGVKSFAPIQIVKTFFGSILGIFR